MLNIIIIEDEPAIVRNLHGTIKDTGEEINLVTTLDQVSTAIEWFNKNKTGYDLVFMDIRLSDGLSFDILQKATITSPIIFVTAYDDYALQGFKTNGIDYILKPFQQSDIEASLKKFKELKGDKNKNDITDFINIAEQLRASYNNYKQSFLFHFRDKLVPVATKDIAWFCSINEVSHACSVDGRKFKTEFTLEQLQQQLDSSLFFRANRQFIVQRKAITEVEFFFNGRLLVKTEPKPDENILISKARVPEFKGWMNS